MAPYLIIDQNDLKIEFPCRLLLCGSSGSGKSSFCRKLIEYSSHMFSVDPDRIIYYHSVDEAKLTQLAESDNRIQLIHASKFSPETYLDKAEDENLLLIFDDMMQSSEIYGEISKLFTMYSRHKNIGCIFMYIYIFIYLFIYLYIFIYIYLFVFIYLIIYLFLFIYIYLYS